MHVARTIGVYIWVLIALSGVLTVAERAETGQRIVSSSAGALNDLNERNIGPDGHYHNDHVSANLFPDPYWHGGDHTKETGIASDGSIASLHLYASYGTYFKHPTFLQLLTNTNFAILRLPDSTKGRQAVRAFESLLGSASSCNIRRLYVLNRCKSFSRHAFTENRLENASSYPRRTEGLFFRPTFASVPFPDLIWIVLPVLSIMIATTTDWRMLSAIFCDAVISRRLDSERFYLAILLHFSIDRKGSKSFQLRKKIA